MRRYLLIIILIVSSFLFADEFIVKSFTQLDNDLSARKYVKHDINGEACALLKIKTDIEQALQFDSNMGLPVSPEKKNSGEYWIYVTPGERALKCMADGFIPKTVPLENESKIKSLTVYELQLSSKEKNIQSLPVTILTTPGDAEKWIDGELLGSGDNYQIPVGEHKLKISKKGYKSYISEIEINIDNVLFKDIKLQEIESLPVQITSTPQKADLYINEEFKGMTNYSIFLVPGKYEIHLSKPGYISIKEDLEINEEKFNGFHFDLEKNVGYLSLSIQPADAKILIDRVEQDIAASYELSPGLHKIAISKDGFTSVNESIEIKKGEKLSKEIVLDQITGSLQLTVQPLDANVRMITKGDIVYQYWHGMKQLKNIPIGNYELEFVREGYEPQKKSITISENKKTVVHVSLSDLNADPEDHKEEMFNIKPSPKYDQQLYNKVQKERKPSKLKIGAEFGPFTLGAKVAYIIDKKQSVNMYLLLRPVGACIMPTFEYYIPLSERIGLEVGPGVHVGYAVMPIPGITIDSDLAIGISAILGLKYSFDDLPLKIGLQYQPSYSAMGSWAASWMDINMMLELEI